MDVKQTLINVLNTLNGVEISGRNNMDKLLGSMFAIEKCINALSNSEPVEVREEQNSGNE